MILIKKETVEFVLEAERGLPKKDQTIFMVKDLGTVDRARFVDEVARVKAGTIEGSILYTRRCIVDIKNLKDENGKLIKFVANENGCIDDEMMNLFPTEVLNEIALFAADMGGLVEAEKK